MAIGEDVLTNQFTYHPPKDGQVNRYKQIREYALTLAVSIDVLAPDSPEKDNAITRVNEAVMWANAAIARNE